MSESVLAEVIRGLRALADKIESSLTAPTETNGTSEVNGGTSTAEVATEPQAEVQSEQISPVDDPEAAAEPVTTSPEAPATDPVSGEPPAEGPAVDPSGPAAGDVPQS